MLRGDCAPARLATRLAPIPTLLLIAAVLFSSGCATTSTGVAPFGSVGKQPSTLLEGASLDEARSVAMASARSKGWTLASPSADQLILERSVLASSPQAQALGTLPNGPAPRVQVHSQFIPLDRGTQVTLQAFILVNPGTEAAKRIDYTKDYQDDLAISLSALQSAWLATEHQLASPAPVPATAAPPAPDDLLQPPTEASPQQQAMTATEDATDEDATETASEGFAAGDDFAGSAWGDGSAWSEDTNPSPDATPWRREEARWPETTTGDSWKQVPAEVTASAGLPAPDPTNPMLVLDSATRTGTWAYYAERFAQQLGCSVSDQGARLLQKTPSFELHEVGCNNGANQLIKCQAGVCQSIRQPLP
ncbi:hypothetical protein [Rhabdochromatium marinum]|uniref:hypothetical protein n=1 Tax=Rhabdochromatium marinum TaxID=48729 RepID=UPI001906772C|nr:hypothetical protein [Rhabdochromatium marinum]MBK1648398.1 hypothetical protein [Rhabdochromatium marinum]